MVPLFDELSVLSQHTHTVHVNQVNLRLLTDGHDEQSINKHPQQMHDNMKKPHPNQSILYEKMKRSSAIAEGPRDAPCQLKTVHNDAKMCIKLQHSKALHHEVYRYVAKQTSIVSGS